MCRRMSVWCSNFQPKQRDNIIANPFPLLKIGEHDIQFVSEFKYLGYLINSYMNDIGDMNRESGNVFMHTNVLILQFGVVECQ